MATGGHVSAVEEALRVALSENRPYVLTIPLTVSVIKHIIDNIAVELGTHDGAWGAVTKTRPWTAPPNPLYPAKLALGTGVAATITPTFVGFGGRPVSTRLDVASLALAPYVSVQDVTGDVTMNFTTPGTYLVVLLVVNADQALTLRPIVATVSDSSSR